MGFALALALIAPAAGAQTASPPAVMQLPPIEAIARPSYPGEFPLRREKGRSGAEEQWNSYLGGQIVRNVTVPTIIPMLPAPGMRNGTAVVFAPGGGFKYLGMDNPEIRQLTELGVSVFVLKYRTDPTDREPKVFLAELYKFLLDIVARNKATGGLDAPPFHATKEALEDGLDAMRLIRSRAAEWGIDPHRIGFMGGSAGATTAIDVGYTADATARPDFIVAMIGPKRVDPVPPTAPPLFYVASADDPLSPAATENVISAWGKAGRSIEAHIFQRGGHGLPRDTTAGRWFDGLQAWLKQNGYLPAAK